MPEGTYYIGDPSYITRGEPGYLWIEKMWHYFYHVHKGLITVDDVTLFVENTYDGDGVYDGFYVDSGCLSVIKIDDLINDERFNFRNMNIKGTRFVRFGHDFSITFDKGNFNIDNQIIIRTSY